MPRPILATIHTAALRHNLDRARRAALDARVWAVVKANAYGHGIERVFDGLARRRRLRAARPGRGRARARARLARPDPAARRRVRAARPGAVLAPRPVAHGALRRADRHAGRPQDAGAAPRLPEDEFGHEPAGLHARALPLRLDAPERAAAGRRDFADDALQRRRRRARHRPPARGVRARPRTTCRASARSPTAPPRCAMPDADARPTGCAPASLLYGSAPDFPEHDAAHWQLQPGDDAVDAADRACRT